MEEERSGVPEKCFTEIQLITRFIAEKAGEDGYAVNVAVPNQETYIITLTSESRKIIVKMLQMQKIFKIYIQQDTQPTTLIWFNHKSFIEPRILNTFSRKSIINQQRLVSILKSRVLRPTKVKREELSLFLQVLDEQYLAVTILKYLPEHQAKYVRQTCMLAYEFCSRNEVYKAIYEIRFGRTGFGKEMNWKKIYSNKLGHSY